MYLYAILGHLFAVIFSGIKYVPKFEVLTIVLIIHVAMFLFERVSVAR